MAQYRALHDFLADTDSDELTLSEGEIVTVVRSNGAEIDEGWILVKRDDGAKGYVPIGYLEQTGANEIVQGGGDLSVSNDKLENSEIDTGRQAEDEEEDEDEDEDKELPTWGRSDDYDDGIDVEKAGDFTGAPVSVSGEEGGKGGEDGVYSQNNEQEEKDDNLLPSWAKIGSVDDDDTRTDQMEQMENRLAEIKGSSKKTSTDRESTRPVREGLLVDSSSTRKNRPDLLDTADDIHSFTDADISLYDLASNNNTFLMEGTTTATPNFRNTTIVRTAVKDSSIAARLSGMPLPPSTVSRSRTATPGAKSEYHKKLRERSGGSCLVKPLFMSAIESGDSASLAKLTHEYFESILEGKLQQEPLLEELDVLSSMAESSVKTTTSLIRRMSDLTDFINSAKTKVDLSVKTKHRREVEIKSQLLATPKKNLDSLRAPHPLTSVKH